jgi:hypothetical protein
MPVMVLVPTMAPAPKEHRPAHGQQRNQSHRAEDQEALTGDCGKV